MDAYNSQISKLESFDDFENEIEFFNANKISSQIQCQAIMLSAEDDANENRLLQLVATGKENVTQQHLEVEMRATDSLIEQVVDLQEMLENLGKNVELTTAKKKHRKQQTMTSDNSSVVSGSNSRPISFTRSFLNQDVQETPSKP